MGRLRTPIATIVLLVLGAWPAGAAATFHEMSIREVYAGSEAANESEYVELQMWSAGQNFVGGHVLKTYNAGGGLTSTDTFAGDVPNGANQSTILLATPAAEAEFGLAADTGLAAGALDPAGGAVCWEALDCVSWGSFSGSLPSPAGTPAAVIPSGMALRRTISPLCPTALDAGDDHDNSAADFSIVFPSPRPNSVAPSERLCGGSGGGFFGGGGNGGGGNGGQGKGAPRTKLLGKPAKKTHDRTPTFRFSSNEAGSTFQCKLDRKRFRSCRSPFTAKRLGFGSHTFEVRARDKSGKLDSSPASYGFRVIPRS
ncbi:MAG TPA: hypothetical protein VG816_13175 [Solirubrobacterales bacterium]|nr:hypothetical protein [Solirubrobacterales bacterium]